MKFYGDAQLQQNNLIEAVIPLDTQFPVSPVVGQIVFKDSILYICVEINSGIPTWVALTNEITAYTYIQNTSASTWTISHPLNTTKVQVQVYDTSNRMVVPGDVVVNDASTVTISFGTPFQGTAVLVTGTFDGNPKQTYAYEYFQTSPSATWVINHGLGRYPSVRVFSGNQEIQPATITFNSLDTLTLTFASAIVGQAKLM